MDHENNPAGRLYLLLDEARTGAVKDQTPAIWEKVLGVDGDRALLLERLAGVLRLPGQIREAVEQFDESQRNLALAELDKIEQMLSSPLNNNREWLRNTVPDTAMQALQWTSTLLGQGRPDPTLHPGQRAWIRSETEALLASVAESGLPQELRTTISGHLRKILLALEEYKVSGTTPVVAATHAALGEIAFRAPFGGDEGRPWVKRFGGLLLAILLTADALSGSLELPMHIQNLLPEATPTTIEVELGDAAEGIPDESTPEPQQGDPAPSSDD